MLGRAATRRVSSHENLAVLAERSEPGAPASSGQQQPSGGLKRLVLPRRLSKRVHSSPQLCCDEQAPHEGARSTAGGLAAALLAVSCAHESVSNPDMSVLLASGGVDVLSAAVCTMPMEAAKFASTPAPDPTAAVTAPGAGMLDFLRAGDTSREAEEASCMASASWEEESLLSPGSILAVRARLTFRNLPTEQSAAEAHGDQYEEAELLESMEDAAEESTKTPRAGGRRARRTFFSALRRRSAEERRTTDKGSEPGSPREPPPQRAKTSFEVTQHKLYPSLSWCQMDSDAVLSVLSPLLASKAGGQPSPLGAASKEGHVRAIEA